MSAVAFDTLKFAQSLRDKANFSPTQAEGISQAFSEAISGQLATRGDLASLATKDDLANLATKADLSALRGEFASIKGEFGGLKGDVARLEIKIEAAKSETLRWIVGAIGFQTIAMMGTVFGLVSFFVH
jgi:hypothetical protein